jgi:glutamate dehydrogenase (NADP+)
MKLEHLEAMNKLKTEFRLPLSQFGRQFPSLTGFEFIQNKSVWECDIQCDVALPCATQNEIFPKHVPQMIANGIQIVAEGADMPSTNETIELYMRHNYFMAQAKRRTPVAFQCQDLKWHKIQRGLHGPVRKLISG